jgi:hypothetical protein
MKITDAFPALLDRYVPTVFTNKTWTKKGPGRRHNKLTRKQQSAMDKAITQGATATQCYQAFEGES